MRRIAFLLVAVVVLAIVPPCLAVVEMPPDANGGKQGIPTSFLQREGMDWIVWVAYEGYRPKTRWSEQATAEGFRFLRFMECFRVLYAHCGDEGYFLLLGESDESGQNVERVVGWVRKDCTVGPEALTVPGIRLHRKAMLVHRKLERNRPKAATGDETFEPYDDCIEMEIDILDAPKKDASKRKSFRLFVNIFFVYGSTNHNQHGITGEEEYVLIGSAQRFRPEAWAEGSFVEGSPENVIQGWVPITHVAFWNTREVIVWDQPSTLPGASPRRTEPGCVFANARDAKDFLDGVAGADEVALFREVFDDQQQSIPFKPHHWRYPLLEWEPEDLRLSEPDGELPEHLPKRYEMNELLKIGCVGGYGGLLKRQLELTRRMISTSEILFVVDDKGSMERCFRHVADAVRRITKKARRTTRPVRVAVAFYNDTDGRRFGTGPIVRPTECFPLKEVTRHGDAIADSVEDHLPASGGDPPELVFRGIKEAIDGAEFSQYARKLVIVIGDCGDKTDNPRDTTDEEAIVDKLLPNIQSPIEFFAVQVCSANRDKHALAFSQQMQNIVRLLNERASKDERTRRTLGAYRNADDTDLKKVLKRRLRDLDRRAAEINQVLTSEGTGESSPEIGAKYRAILQDAGIDYERLKAQGGVPLFHEGYVWRYAPGPTRGVSQVRSQISLDYATIEDLISCMEKLTDKWQGILDRRIAVEDALAELIEVVTGEPADPKLSFEEQVLNGLGLVANSPLLKKPVGTKFAPRFVHSEIAEIRHRVDLLKDILEGKQRKWDKQQGTFAGEAVPKYIPIGDTKAIDRHFTLHGSAVKWYWIDAQDELP